MNVFEKLIEVISAGLKKVDDLIPDNTEERRRLKFEFYSLIANSANYKKEDFVNIITEAYGSWVIKLDENGKVVLEEVELLEREVEVDNGGTIIFSSDVDATVKDKSKFVRMVKRVFKTIANRLKLVKKVTKAFKSVVPGDIGFTIGKGFKGRYYDKKGNVFDEKSYVVDVVGVDSETLDKIADALAKEFEQEAVLVKNNNENKVYFWYVD